jgi:DNA-binding MarR family transcriptional regulator
MMLDRLLNDGIILQDAQEEGDTIIHLISREERSEAALQAQREEIAKQMFANLTEEDKKIFLKALSAVHKIIKKVA